MRHNKKGKKFSRPKDARKALIRILVKQLIQHGRILTTVSKAKVIREFVEPMVTRAKNGTVHDRRMVAREVNEPKLIKKLFDEIGPVFKERNGGYTRIIKYSFRKGDNAPTAYIEFVDREKMYKKEDPKEVKKGEKVKKEKQPKEPKAPKETKKKEAKKEEKKESKK